MERGRKMKLLNYLVLLFYFRKQTDYRVIISFMLIYHFLLFIIFRTKTEKIKEILQK